MTLRVVVSACCAMLVLLGPPAQAQRGTACATEAQRKIEMEKLIEKIDWFLSIIEEVPEGFDRQFGDPQTRREQVIAHPLFKAYLIRWDGADIKWELRSSTGDTPKRSLQAAINALEKSARFMVNLILYADDDRGRRIIDVTNWIGRAHALPEDFARYAQCLVADLVSSGAGSGPPARPR